MIVPVPERVFQAQFFSFSFHEQFFVSSSVLRFIFSSSFHEQSNLAWLFGHKQQSQLATMKKKGKKKEISDLDDPRFAQMVNDPRFRTMRNQEKKVKIDDRFQGMFSERRFTGGHRVDKRGLAIQKARGEDLENHYELDRGMRDGGSSLNVKSGAKVPDARGVDSDIESSSSDEESEEEEEDSIDHDWGELDKDAPRTDEATRRLAVCNIDWDRIRAVDLFVLFSSFKPDNGVIKSVTVYPSEFGKKRMAEEEVRGPTEIVETPVLPDDGVKHEEGDAEEEFMTEKLRQYQLNRLRYFYAVVDCDSPKTGALLYDELDGFEYENSSSALDVRFIPDDMEFDDEPSSSCTTHPDFATYKAPNFVTTALQQSKVQMTWDETDPTRRQKMDEAFNSKSEQALDDLEAFLASSEDEESEEDGEECEEDGEESEKQKNLSVRDKVCKYKQLLKTLEEEEDEDTPEMDISFPEPTEEESGDEIEPTEEESGDEIGQPNEPVLDDSDAEKTKAKKDSKKRSKRKSDDVQVEKSNEDTGLELLLMDEESDKKHFDYSRLVQETSGKKKKRKRKQEEPVEDNFNFDPDDPRFSRLFSSHLYNIDPSDPHFKNTQAMQLLMSKKVKASSALTESQVEPKPESKPESRPESRSEGKKSELSRDKEVSSLVASIRRKTKGMNSAKSD